MGCPEQKRELQIEGKQGVREDRVREKRQREAGG